MKKFIKYIGFYSFIMMIFLFLIGYQGFDLSKIKKVDVGQVLNNRVDHFETFIKNKNSINLILGSSIIRESMIPDSLGGNWYSFTNSMQNIYNSYKFLEFYQDSIKLDTIIIGIQPFDFPHSYIKNRLKNLPHNNADFFIFGHDSINTTKNIIYKKIQNYKNYFFPDLLNLKNLTKHSKKETMNKNEKEHDIWTKQGFMGRIHDRQLNLDSLYNFQPKSKRLAYRYFYNVNKKPNMKYFDLFNDLTKSLNIKVVYVLTPKSKYYHLDLTKYGYDFIWNNILDKMGIRNVQIWNYEKMNTDSSKFNWFCDDTHISYDGAKLFTKTIRKRLRD